MKVGYWEENENTLFQDLDRLNLKNEQLRFLRSSKTIGLGRKRPRKRALRKSTRDEDSSNDVSVTAEELMTIGSQQYNGGAVSSDQKNTPDVVLVDWNRIQWNTRKRKKGIEEDNVVNEQSLVRVEPVVEACWWEREKQQESVEQGLDSKEEEEQQPKTCLETSSNSLVSFCETSRDTVNSKEENEEKDKLAGNDHCATKPIIKRSKKEVERRMQLPICEREQEIVEMVHERDIVVITAETGSGKTTQVPQFLYEAGYCSPNENGYCGKIVITQPRRVGAFACSSRVAKELHVRIGAEVGYHVRHFKKVSNETKMEFVTDGILLRLLQKDILLRQYSVVVLDEAHERSVNTDLILGLVTRSVRLRRCMLDNNEPAKIPQLGMEIVLPPLKFIVMSATLDVDVLLSNDKLFAPYIPQPATLQIETRGYPVHIHFAKKTPVNYIEAAFKTVCKIHRQLPPGNVLVFLTGRREVLQLCKKLSMELQVGKSFSSGKCPIQNVRILPLYSMLPWKKQQRVFFASPKECRTIVVATNVAETSITIPNIAYVVDSGKVKKKEYTSVQDAFSMIRFHVKWTSQSSAEQRAGRTGRTCEGHCYRLYSAAVFLNEMEEEEEPEILRTPADALLLKLKALSIDVHTFPFPSPPSEDAVERAERVLQHLGVVRTCNDKTVLTPLGKKIAKLPLSSRLGKLIIDSCDYSSIIVYAIRIAAILTVSDLFISKEEEEENTSLDTMLDQSSEILSILYAFCAWEYHMAGNASSQAPEKFNLRDKSVREVSLIINQLSRLLIRLGWIPKSYCRCTFPSLLYPPSKSERNVLITTILGCFPDQVCRHLSTPEATQLGLKGRRKRTAFETMSGRIVFLSRERMMTQPVSSIEFLCYVELLDKSSSLEDDYPWKHVYIRYCTVVTASMLVDIAASLCHFSPPLIYPLPIYDVDRGCVVCSVDVTYGPLQWPLGTFQVPMDNDKYLQLQQGGNKYDFIRMDRYRVFAQSFLQGKVFSSLSLWTKYLKESPNAMFQAPSKPCVMQLYMALSQHKIYRRKDLLLLWDKQPKFLLEEYLNFVHNEQSIVSEITQCWPPV